MFGANTLLYMNQSSPSLGFSLNCLTDTTTNFQLRQSPQNLAIAMDCSHAAFVSKEQIVVSLRTGEIYVLTLVPDGLRGIKNILFEKAAAGVLPSCVSPSLPTISSLGQQLTPPHSKFSSSISSLLCRF